MLFPRKSTGDSDCSFEKCVGRVRPEVQEKIHSKPELNWIFLTLRIEVDQSKQTSAQKIGTFQNPGDEFPPDNKFFFRRNVNAMKNKKIPPTVHSRNIFILTLDWNADKRIEHFCQKRPKLSSTDAITFNKENNNLSPKLLSRQIKCCFESPVENRSPKV